MSLDVYLYGPATEEECMCMCGHRHTTSKTEDYFDANVTHNLAEMADEAGIYKHLWRPEELGIARAKDLIEPLTKGLALLVSDRPRFEKLNPDNGWGSYENFVPWVSNYLQACKDYPEAFVRVSR